MKIRSKPVRNWNKKKAVFMGDRLIIGGYQVMMSWETPLMHKMADMLCSRISGDILEVGFGMGISSTRIQESGVTGHTIIEPHPEVYEKALIWKKNYPESKINIINDFWQNLTGVLKTYDGIFFDTFTPSDKGAERKRLHFFEYASTKLLKPGGAMIFYHMSPKLEYSYQKQLFNYFSRLHIERFDITPPDDCKYAHIKDNTLCVLAVK